MFTGLLRGRPGHETAASTATQSIHFLFSRNNAMAASVPFKWSREQKEAMQEHIDNPVPRKRAKRAWVPKFPLTPPPAEDKEEVWTAADFEARGFPSYKIPDTIEHPLIVEAWNALIQEGVDCGRISAGQAEELHKIRSWFTEGVPDILTGKAKVVTVSDNILSPSEIPVALDSIGDYISNGHG